MYSTTEKLTEIISNAYKAKQKQCNLGDLYTKKGSEKSFFGYHPSVLKSGIQKYARRAEVVKGLWCLVEMDLFSLLEWDGTALDSYLRKHPEQSREKVQRKATAIRTNMINRLVVIMSEEVSISAWWMPSKILELYEKWIENRDNPSSRKYLVDMYRYLTSQKMIRLISDLKSVYLIPPDYVKPKQMKYLREIHQYIKRLYPEIYSGQAKVGDVKWEMDMGRYPVKLQPCIKGIMYNLEIGSDNVFYWVRKLCDIELKDKLPLRKGKNKNKIFKYSYLKIIWEILHRFIDQHSEYEFLRETILALQKFYTMMNHREKPIYLYHAVLLIVRRKEIDWSSQPPSTDTPFTDVEKLYRDHLGNGKMAMDDYVIDIHTKEVKRGGGCLEKFAVEGAYVKNENDKFHREDYRKIYIKLKKEQDYDYKKREEDTMNQGNLEMLAQKVGVPIKKLSAEILDQLKGALQAQLRTAGYKKHVYIVKRLIFKGPYERDDHFLIKNLVYTYAVQILEEAFQLPERQRGSLGWEYLGCGDNNQYYLVSRNVGKWKNIPFNLKDSKIEKNVKLVPRGGAVLRLREVEDNGQLTAGIKLAYLQHLYLRYLLGIGDSGPQNVLIRQDYKSTGRLVAGIDLEERCGIKVKTSRLDHLFNTEKNRKKYQILYGPDVRKIKLLSCSQLDQRTIDRLSAVGIDLNRIKENMELWDRLN